MAMLLYDNSCRHLEEERVLESVNLVSESQENLRETPAVFVLKQTPCSGSRTGHNRVGSVTRGCPDERR